MYGVTTEFVGGIPMYLPLTDENNFLPDLDAIDNDTWKKAKTHLHQLPQQSHGRHGPSSFYEMLIEKAKEFGVHRGPRCGIHRNLLRRGQQAAFDS